MESGIVVTALLLLFALSAIWFLITGLILLFTGKDISIGDLGTLFRSGMRYSREKDDLEAILLHRFRYYSDLPEELKPRFLKRVSDFIDDKEFSAAEGLEITPEHKVLIAAAAIQVSFGLDKYLLDHFSRIILYPKEYFSHRNQNYHKGEVNIGGAIVLSMEDFFFGYNNATDGLNLGIHEMSHALQLELFLREDHEQFFGLYFIKWQQEAEIEMNKMQETDNPVLRDYARTNISEFFAICVENFFERPVEFKDKMPELYERMTILLNQDPADKTAFIRTPREKITDDPLLRFDPGVQIYKTDFPWSDFIQELGFGLFIWIFPAIAFKDSEIVLLLLLLIGLIFFVRILPMNRFCLYEKALIVKPLFRFWSSGSMFVYKRIVLVSQNDTGTGLLEIVYLSDGAIVHKRYAWPSNNTDPKDFYSLLHEKNVLIKSEMI